MPILPITPIFKKLALSLSEINKFRYLCIRISQET